MIRGFASLLVILLLNGCANTGGVDGVESLYANIQNIQASQNMDSTQGTDLQNQINLLVAQLGQMVGIAPTTLYGSGNTNKAFAISNSLMSAANMLVGSASLPCVNAQMLNGLQTRVLGVAATMPGNYSMQQAWNTIQFDLISEFISLQASYLSLVPQYMLQLLPYMSKNRMQSVLSTLKSVTAQLQQAMATT